MELKNKELERQLKKEKDRADNFEKELHQLKVGFWLLFFCYVVFVLLSDMN